MLRFLFQSLLNFSDCQEALGMEDYGIPNEQVRASSEWNSNHAAIQGRLHYKPPSGKQGAWSAKENDKNQWLQIDLGSVFTRVTGVATQGRYNYNQWVTSCSTVRMVLPSPHTKSLNKLQTRSNRMKNSCSLTGFLELHFF